MFISFTSRFVLPALLATLALSTGGCVTSGGKSAHKPFYGSWTDQLWPQKPMRTVSIPEPIKKVFTPSPKRVWNGDGVTGSPSITIALGEQRAYFFMGKRQVGETDISSGRDGYDTPPGHYEVIQKDKDHRSTLYGEFVNSSGGVISSNADLTKQSVPPGATFRGAKMPYFLRFRDGYGLHAGNLPGHRASHGCVRLPLEMAGHFFNHVQVGTSVLVLP